MATAQATTNKATLRRFDEVVNTGDAELFSKTIDEIFEPDVLIRTHCQSPSSGGDSLDGTGFQATNSKETSKAQNRF